MRTIKQRYIKAKSNLVLIDTLIHKKVRSGELADEKRKRNKPADTIRAARIVNIVEYITFVPAVLGFFEYSIHVSRQRGRETRVLG